MKKYLSLIALCLSSFVHGSGFANLKAIQDQFHALIYQAGDLGATQPAPEVPYIAGLLGNRIDSTGENSESRYIYETLYGKKSPRGRRAIAGIDQAKADAFDALSFHDFARYDGYQNSGHSVLGVAAQEAVASVSSSPVASMPLPFGFPSSASAGGGMNFGGGNNPFAGGGQVLLGSGKKKAAVSAPPTPVVVAAPQSLLQKVQARLDGLRDKQKKSKDDNADIAILSELADELSDARMRDADQQERYKDLLKFFNKLQDSSDPMAPMAAGGLRRDLKTEALQKFPQQVSSPPSPVDAAVAGGTALLAPIVTAVTSNGVSAASKMFGNAASNPMLAKMEAEQAAISSIDTLIQKAFSMQPMQANDTERAIDQCINGSVAIGVPPSITNNKVLLERLLEKLRAVNSKTPQQAMNIQIISKRIPKIADDSEDDDDGDEIDISAIDVNSLSIVELKEKRKLLRIECGKIEDDFGDTDAIEQKIAEINAKIEELEPSAKLASQPSVAAVGKKEEVYLTDEDLVSESSLGEYKIKMYKKWRDDNEKTPEAARLAMNSDVNVKYKNEPYTPKKPRSVSSSSSFPGDPGLKESSSNNSLFSGTTTNDSTAVSSPYSSSGDLAGGRKKGGAALPFKPAPPLGGPPVVQQHVVVSPPPQPVEVAVAGGGVASEIPVDADGVKTYLSALHSQLQKRDYGGGSPEQQIAYLADLLVKLDAIDAKIVSGGDIKIPLKNSQKVGKDKSEIRQFINTALSKLRSGR